MAKLIPYNLKSVVHGPRTLSIGLPWIDGIDGLWMVTRPHIFETLDACIGKRYRTRVFSSYNVTPRVEWYGP